MVCIIALLFSFTAWGAQSPKVARVLEVAPVWAGHPVGFDLLTAGGQQYAAFYDARRQMTVAARSLASTEWHFVKLPSEVKWDSHNSLALAVDAGGHLHLAGNMHVAPLVYFRSRRPHDIASLERVASMVGRDEDRCTYPRFLRGPDGKLVFMYRDGRSGSGNQIINVYDEETRAWRRLLSEPLTDGQGRMNAYFHGPVVGPDGYYHLVWVWRDTPDCATNHDLSYARSKDLVHWETSSGRTLRLPIRVDTGEIVDPVPVRGGIINNNTKLGFDSRRRPVITYHKFDARGRTQIYNARLERGGWRIYQTSDWDYRWEFQGGGTIPFEISTGSVGVDEEGVLGLDFSHVKYGVGRWRLDERTLRPLSQGPRRTPWPPELEQVESQFPGMRVHLHPDSKDKRFVLRWETLGPNRDRPRDGPLPPPSVLRVYELGESKK